MTQRTPRFTKADIVCFGTVNNCYILVVDAIPSRNAGTEIQNVTQIIGDDAAIVAQTLCQWGIQVGLICNAVGNDDAGRRIMHTIKQLGISCEIRTSRDITTPIEVSASDSNGGRTYFWERRPSILSTLGTADLSMIDTAKYLYVDWYDSSYALSAIRRATTVGVPVFLNIESQFRNTNLIEQFAQSTDICQVSLDEPGGYGSSPIEIADNLLNAGVQTVLITMGANGCFATDGKQSVLLDDIPQIKVVDGYAAGAMFSAAFISGQINDRSLSDCTRFAAAAGTLSCTAIGPSVFPVSQIEEFASKVSVSYL